jgi:hypothetical protein
MIIGYVIVAVLLECAVHHRASHSRTATARFGHQRRTHREIPCRWPTASPVRVGRDDLGSLSNLVDLLAAPV